MKAKVIINDVIIKDDYSTDPKLVFNFEIDEELDDIIPTVEIVCNRNLYDYVDLRQNQVVEIYMGETPVRVFYGNIVNIENNDSNVTINASMETIKMLRTKVNKIYRYYA